MLPSLDQEARDWFSIQIETLAIWVGLSTTLTTTIREYAVLDSVQMMQKQLVDHLACQLQVPLHIPLLLVVAPQETLPSIVQDKNLTYPTVLLITQVVCAKIQTLVSFVETALLETKTTDLWLILTPKRDHPFKGESK